MTKLLLIILLAVASTMAHANLPPKRFDHPYKGKLKVTYLGKTAMRFVCGGAIACAYGGGRSCHIYLPKFKTPDPLWMIRRHEIGHCNGWPANHPA